MQAITRFKDEYRFLSNFWFCPIQYDGVTYPSNEHFYMAMKTVDKEQRAAIAACKTPAQAKRLGRKVVLREDWNEIRLQVMEHGLRIKFANNDLAEKLIATGSALLVEGNYWHDNFWGVCSCRKCTTGSNHLGKLLMQIRKEISKP